MPTGQIPQRPLGSTGLTVSAIGLGGYHLGQVATEREAIRIVHAAIDVLSGRAVYFAYQHKSPAQQPDAA